MAKNNDPNTLMLNIGADASGVKKELNKLQKDVFQSMKQINNIVKKTEGVKGEGLDEAFQKITKSYAKTTEGKVDALTKYSKQSSKLLNDAMKAIAQGDQASFAVIRKQMKTLQESYKDDRVKLNRGIRDPEKQAMAEQRLATFEQTLTPLTRQQRKLQELNKQLELARQGFVEFAKAGKSTKNSEKTIKSLTKQVGRLEKKAEKSGGAFQKLWGRIRNISIYRSIRTVLKWITQGFEDGINNFVQYSEEANSAMSNINASLVQIRNTMGVAMTSVLQAIQPLITSLANGLVDLINSFNLAMAKVSGKDTYSKAKKNIEDYAASVDEAKGSLADFDKFRTLDAQQTDPMEMFEEATIAENENRMSSFFETIIKLVKEVWATISQVWNSFTELGIWDILLNAFSEISKIIGIIVTAVLQLIKSLFKMGALKSILYGLVAAWMAYKVAATLAAISSAAAWMMAHPITGALAITAAVATLSGVISAIKGIGTSNISSGSGFVGIGLADGGFTTANFIATNENGVREWVGKNAGSTAVVNDTQMSDIMYQAVKDGCYEGVIDALSDADSYGAGNSSSTSAQVQIQGETLFTIISNEATKRGLKFSRV